MHQVAGKSKTKTLKHFAKASLNTRRIVGLLKVSG
jgi:hypothetical protein